MNPENFRILTLEDELKKANDKINELDAENKRMRDALA